MDKRSESILSIGEFASLAQLSFKALRLYDQLDLFKPVYVDPATGYRFYHPDQLQHARLIRTMRQMDMPLATIRQIMTLEPAKAEALVYEYYQAQENRLERIKRLLPALITAIHQEKLDMQFEVQTKAIDSHYIVSVTQNVSIENLPVFIDTSIKKLLVYARQQGYTSAGAPYSLYHGPVNPQDNGPVEVCLPVNETPEPQSGIQAHEMPGGQFALVTLRGTQCDFPDILQGYDAVCDWISLNGFKMVGPPQEIYLSQPGELEIMEIAWQFE